jgi:hypothetical protein
MTRVRRRPGKIEFYFEWIESIFWLVPMGIVLLGAASGAVVIYLSSSLFTTGCARVAGVGRQKRLKLDQEQKTFRRTRMTAEAASPATDSGQSAALLTLQIPESAACDSSIMVKRAGINRLLRRGLSGCMPFRECHYTSTLSAPRFLGATFSSRARFNRF